MESAKMKQGLDPYGDATIQGSWKILDKDGFRQDINGLQNEIAELKRKLEKYIELGRGRQKQNAIGGWYGCLCRKWKSC